MGDIKTVEKMTGFYRSWLSTSNRKVIELGHNSAGDRTEKPVSGGICGSKLRPGYCYWSINGTETIANYPVVYFKEDLLEEGRAVALKEIYQEEHETAPTKQNGLAL